ncbi:Proteophosphoglycan ppg4 [Rhodotorula toruloides ATCC 204091]|uniref:Proteophosphoglycan ppg4 n=1 Tax=Rhodotorula toruloides TaxID=5286 RepID=A0A0K3CG39_RHOTO|nr:Proteophosphoglycan ppg4 [Rhodotorula toruloides ATCC 204091]KAK4333173.1 Proteophosphoglycan ppg4 [Rhodotorula toruloides]PRQ73401.1 Proteophosphoglycan ppg4 [Rhodotorula toruloides]
MLSTTRRDELEPAAVACEADNDRLRVEVLKVHAEIEGLEEEAGQEADEALRRIRAMERELAQLEATLEVLRADDSSEDRGLPHKSKVVAEELARENLAKTVAGLQTALNWEEERLEEEQIMLDRDKLYMRDAETLNTTLSARAAEAWSAARRTTGESLVVRAQTHYDSLLARFRLLQGGLVSFIDEVLADDASDALFDPFRSEGLAKKGKKAAASSFDLRGYLRSNSGEPEDGESRAFQLKKLIESLMNLSVTSSQDPYLPDEPAFPPELVAFLVRAGLAEEEVVDGASGANGLVRRIRLRDFGGLRADDADAGEDGGVV